MTIEGYRFVKTCDCSPEQYDVFDTDGNQVCYVRLRWGSLTAEYPDVGGTIIYAADIGYGWTGCFVYEEQRRHHLTNIAREIERFGNYTCEDCVWHEWEDRDDGSGKVMTCDEGHDDRCGVDCKACEHFSKLWNYDDD